MFFRNLTLFRFAKGVIRDSRHLRAALETVPLRDIGPLELKTSGFVPPFATDDIVFELDYGRFAMLTLATWTKLLPGDVVTQEVNRRLKARIEAETTAESTRVVGAREKKQVRDEVITQLLPAAFSRKSVLNAYVDLNGGWLMIDTASRAQAEAMVNRLRDAFGRFPAVPLAPEESPRVVMTDWLLRGRIEGWHFGDECELRDPAEAGAVVRLSHQDLETDEVREHLKSGKQCFKLGLEYNQHVGFTLDEGLVLRRLRFFDSVLDKLKEESAESREAEISARFALMALELQQLLVSLSQLFVFGDRPTLRVATGEVV